MDEAPDQQQAPRIPGVRYRAVKRTRIETTVIDGIPSHREVEYEAWEPVPPRDWDAVFLRGVIAVAVVMTLLAIVATTASVGGLLSALVGGPVAYLAGTMFTATWVAVLGLEWLSRVNPDQARVARAAGWAQLVMSMTAVVIYGHTIGKPWAGAVGAVVDLMSKGLWTLLIRYHSVPLAPGVAHWLTDQEQRVASRVLLADRLSRLNRTEAYRRAVGGVEFAAADAMLTHAQTTTGTVPAVEAPAAVPSPAPVPPITTPTPIPAPGPTTVPAAVVDTVTTPAPVLQPPAAAAEPPRPEAPSPRVEAPADVEADEPATVVIEINRPSIAQICRDAIKDNPEVTDAELVAAALANGHADTAKLADTVRRTAQRVDPGRKATGS